MFRFFSKRRGRVDAEPEAPAPAPPAPPVPPRRLIFLNALPASASRFIAQALIRGFDARPVVVTGGQFPTAALSRRILTRIRSGAHIAQESIQPDAFNRLVLDECVDSMVLHVRDPRQVALAWVQHLQGQIEKGNLAGMRAMGVPADFPGYPAERKLDFVIHNHLAGFAGWLARWREALVEGGLQTRVLLTRFDDMKADPEALLDRIAAFHDIDPARLKGDPPEPGRTRQDRGGHEEWRSAMTPAQQAATHRHLPPDLLSYYGWAPE